MKKRVMLPAALLLLIIVVATALIILWANNNYSNSKENLTSSNYLVYQGKASRIFLVAMNATYSYSNETYTAPYSDTVHEGDLLYVVNVELRNDYSADDPPPANGYPISPVDGTAYVYMTALLYDKHGQLNSTNVSKTDFSLPFDPGTAIVLAKGETSSVNILMLINQRTVDHFKITLLFVGDSIPR